MARHVTAAPRAEQDTSGVCPRSRPGDAFGCVSKQSSAAAAASHVCESRVLSVPVPHLL